MSITYLGLVDSARCQDYSPKWRLISWVRAAGTDPINITSKKSKRPMDLGEKDLSIHLWGCSSSSPSIERIIICITLTLSTVCIVTIWSTGVIFLCSSPCPGMSHDGEWITCHSLKRSFLQTMGWGQCCGRVEDSWWIVGGKANLIFQGFMCL